MTRKEKQTKKLLSCDYYYYYYFYYYYYYFYYDYYIAIVCLIIYAYIFLIFGLIRCIFMIPVIYPFNFVFVMIGERK